MEQGAAATRALLQLFHEDRERIESLGQAASSALRVFSQFQAAPILSVTKIAGILGLSIPTVNSALRNLGELGIAEELTGRRRGHLFVYRRYLDILSEGTEPINASSGTVSGR